MLITNIKQRIVHCSDICAEPIFTLAEPVGSAEPRLKNTAIEKRVL